MSKIVYNQGKRFMKNPSTEQQEAVLSLIEKI